MNLTNKIPIGNGYYTFKLNTILKAKNVSYNKLMNDTNTDFKVLKRYATGNLSKLDIFVLARLCNYFKCNMNDLVSYNNN